MSFPPDPQNPTFASTGAFVDELARSGLRHAVICPGSRSTPLALNFAMSPAIRCWMHVDERAAAFFALGMAKRLDQPVALLCTSGTAAANFLPAIVEANLTHVPLLVLTSDRPAELRDCGAPQAIDQHRLYGTHVKWFVETALPEATNEAMRYIRTIASRAFAQTQALPAGPVHVNLPLREPLTPEPLLNQPLPPLAARDSLAWQGRPGGLPYTGVVQSAWQQATPMGEMLRELAAKIGESPRGLILVGPQTDPELVEPLLQLARKTGYPILADPLSQLRGKTGQDGLVISSYDAFLRAERFSAHYEPQLILRFGPMPTSKPVLLYLKRYPICQQVIIDPQHGWQEPMYLAALIFYAEAKNFCQILSDMLDHLDNLIDEEIWRLVKEFKTQEKRVTWTRAWLEADRVTRLALTPTIEGFTELFEGRVFTELAGALPARSMLYVGNSMPVRDMDTFFWPEAYPVRCLGNRGANGIDGVISSALGASAASGDREAAVLVIGDLSFFHDLNGLLAAHLHRLNLTIILMNNNGGGIFSFLPQAAYPEHFEQLFGTPTNLDFRPVVKMYGGSFQRIGDWKTFHSALETGLSTGGLHVIEIPTVRQNNVTMHRQLWQAVEQALERAGLLAGNGE